MIACPILTLDGLSCWRDWSWRTIVSPSLSIGRFAAHERVQLAVRHVLQRLGHRPGLFPQLEGRAQADGHWTTIKSPGRLGTQGLLQSLWRMSRLWPTAVHRHHQSSQLPIFLSVGEERELRNLRYWGWCRWSEEGQVAGPVEAGRSGIYSTFIILCPLRCYNSAIRDVMSCRSEV